MKTVQILTHPIIGNYGGILQNYALSLCLTNIGVYNNLQMRESNLVNRYKSNRSLYWKCRVISFLKRYLKFNYNVSVFELEKVGKAFYLLFGDKQVQKKSEFVDSGRIPVVVGSDQVWRKMYVDTEGGICFYFLHLLTSEIRAQSISYAASFGSDEWEGSPEETEECGRLLREFKAVSVREHSGVKICKDVFGVDAVQMPDPTLLLHPEDYGKIIDSEKTWLPEGKYVAAYVLDETAGKAELLQNSAKSVDMQLQHLMPHADAKKGRDRFPISVPQWLRLIRDCEYFITDSFHGCVFAIIFNKPFVCLGNEGRGNARFDTLLGTFGLEDRMITDATPEKVLKVLNTPIDWARVNAIHDAERERGINFLKENLT